MKNIVIASIIAIASATTASAYTCKNTAEIINGETVYTYSQCGNQAPASQTTLDQMSYAANNPGNDPQEEAVEEVVVVVEVAAPTRTREVLGTPQNTTNKKGYRVVKTQIKVTKENGGVVYKTRKVTFNTKKGEKVIRVKNHTTGESTKTIKAWNNSKPAVKS
jgi:hypothetical protein